MSNNSYVDRYGLFRVKGDLHVTGSVQLLSLSSLLPSSPPSSPSLFPPPVISLGAAADLRDEGGSFEKH